MFVNLYYKTFPVPIRICLCIHYIKDIFTLSYAFKKNMKLLIIGIFRKKSDSNAFLRYLHIACFLLIYFILLGGGNVRSVYV